MKLESYHEIRINPNKRTDAQLIIHTELDGQRIGAGLVAASGPRKYIEAYVAGRITFDELTDKVLREEEITHVRATKEFEEDSEPPPVSCKA
jgi:hypothetical protein